MSAREVRVPDIGDFKDIPVIEVLVKPGDTVGLDDPLVTLESDKATLEVPSPAAGVIGDIKVKVGDKLSEGSVILMLDEAAAAGEQAPAAGAGAPTTNAAAGEQARTAGSGASTTPPAAGEASAASPPSAGGAGDARSVPATAQESPASDATPAVHHASGPESHPIAPPARIDESGFQKAHASPGVRAFARELGVDLGQLRGSGPKERILREDVQKFVREVVTTAGAGGSAGAAAAAGGGARGAGTFDLLPWPQIDFSRFGEIEIKPLSRIRKLSGANLARNWVMIPHVTQHDDADITGLEAFRIQVNKENEKAGIKVTMLAFLIKAVASVLKQYPDFNASLDGDNLVLKKFCNIGFAADTPNGLVVPVIKSADSKGVLEIAQEMGLLSAKARDGKLGPADMQGGCFSISSLGGIGGTYFTPIINAPEVAILGVGRAQKKPVWDGAQFVPRLLLPLSLSYDHRVIDGASAARFTSALGLLLADLRRSIL